MHEFLMRRNTVLAALTAGRRTVYTLWVQTGSNDRDVKDIMKAAADNNVTVKRASKEKLSTLAGDNRHQGVLLEAGSFVYAELDDFFALAAERDEMPLLLVLDLLHGPQNIGSLLRTAEICGVHGVVMQDRRAPDITPTVSQYSAGAAEHLLISQVTNLARAIERLKEREVWVIGLDSDESAAKLGSVDLNMPLAMVVGHEGSGLRRIVKKQCDFIVRLPMRGQTESFNAAVAGSIALYTAWQSRESNAVHILRSG
jgi:23S rRNA (guanosine2251-2'-O)-methyltransferase